MRGKRGISIFFRWFIAIATLLVVAGFGWLVATSDIAVLNPAGEVASQQRDLLVFAFLLSMVVVIPVFALTIFVAVRYREGNKKAAYRPDWSHSRILETIWWSVPALIIVVLGVVTWRTSHTLDPYKSLASNVQPVEIQVIALEWKWLFLYPEYDVASVDLLPVPTDRPLNFSITSDAPMNSFWIPKLGSQIYAMKGMQTKLHLSANKPGTYRGLSTNISGEGFADMNFKVQAMSDSDFSEWVRTTKGTNSYLDTPAYDKLAKPGTLDEPILFSGFTPTLFNDTIASWMSPSSDNSTTNHNKEGAH